MKYGLKLWSTDDEELFKEAIELVGRKEIDFMELYIVPNSFVLEESEKIKSLKNIPTVIHAPHMEHGFDVSSLDDAKIEIFKSQVIGTADFLNSKFIVVHAALGTQEDFERNIKKINDPRILIENMPKVGLEDEACFAYSYEQLRLIKDSGFDLCLDFSHAIKSALAQGTDYKDFVEKLIFDLKPAYFHICNGKVTILKDEHRDLFDGDFDIKWIKNALMKFDKEREVYLTSETPKGGKGLENDLKNINYFRAL